MYHDSIAIAAFAKLVEKFKIATVFETGSYHGRGTEFFSRYVPTVVSCDISEHYWNLKVIS